MCHLGNRHSVVPRSGVPTTHVTVSQGRCEREERPMNGKPLKGRLQAFGSAVSLALAVLAAPPAEAGSGSIDATFYELTENMSVQGGFRVGRGSLMGEAKVGTPLCPDVLIQLLIDNHLIGGSSSCDVVAYGEDRINLTNGSGSLTATVSVTVEM